MKRDIPKSISDLISLLAMLVFVTTALSQLFSRGICCADDAWYAVIAKNVANGLGYTSTIPTSGFHFFASHFDPYMGSGPMNILPASLFIKIIGNSYWAPGLSNIVCWSVLLILIWSLARRYNSGFGLSLAVLTFLFLSYATTTFHYEQWFAFLGEVPAALFVILGILLFFRSDFWWWKVLGGVSFALAVLEKPLSLLAFAAFLVALAILYLLDRSQSVSCNWLDVFHNTIALSIGFLPLLALFEAWKLLALGPIVYIQHWKDSLSLSSAQGMNLASVTSLYGLYKTRTGALLDRFAIFLPEILLNFILVWFAIRNDRKLVRIFIALMSVVVIYSAWWIFLSNGFPRYYFTPLLAIISVVSIPFLLPFSRKQLILLFFALIIALSSYSWDRLRYPLSVSGGNYFKPSAQTQALLKVSQFLAPVVGKEPIVTQWWATGADIEYIMDAHLVFTHYKDINTFGSKPFLVVVNTHFVSNDDQEFSALLAGCKDKQQMDVYLIAKCSPIHSK